MPIGKDKLENLEKEMQSLNISEDDITEKFILGSGKGGQKVNKSATCVYIKHIPSGIEVKCQKERSRELNRYQARRLLCEKIRERDNKEISEKQKEIERIRRQKKRRSRKTKEKLLEDKRRRSETKSLRKPPEP